MGLLDNLNKNLGSPGTADALGLLGAYLMAAGSPTTDPNASGRFMAQGAQAFSNTRRNARLDAGNSAMQRLQQQNLQQQMEARERADQERAAMGTALLGSHLGGQGPAQGSFRGAQEEGLTQPGLLSAHPVLGAMAKADPMAAAQGLLSKQARDAAMAEQQRRFDLTEQGRDRRLDKTLAAKKDKSNTLTQKAQMLVASGVDPKRAMGIVGGRYNITTMPDGSRRITDLGGQAVGQDIRPASPKAATPTKQVDVEPGVGGEGFFKNIANTLTDAVGMGHAYPKAAEAKEALKELQVVTMTTLQDAVPGKPSRYLLEKLEPLSIEPGSWFTGEESAKVKLRRTRDMIARSVDTITKHLDKPMLTLSHKQKWELKRDQLLELKNQYDGLVKNFRSEEGGGWTTLPSGVRIREKK